MPRIARLTDALRGHGKALVSVGAAAAAIAGASAGTAAAATTSPAARPAVISTASTAPTLGHTSAPAELTGHTGAPGLGIPAGTTAPHSDTAHAAPAKSTAPATAVAQTAPAHQPAAQQSSSQPAPSQPSGPYEFYDSTTPSQIPAGHEIATYADGAFAVQPSSVSGKQVLWIDTNATDPNANVLDVEPGDATPSQAATWAQQRLTEHPGDLAVIYTMRSDWSAAQQAVSALPQSMQSHIRWWIADPTGTPHIVPGATATQWYWGPDYDISSANGSL